MSPTTRITDRGDDLEVETEFPDFLSLYAKGVTTVKMTTVRSDVFRFMGHRILLQVSGTDVMNEAFTVLIRRHKFETECCVVLRLGIKKMDGQVENVAHISNLTFLRHEVCRSFEFPSFSRDILQRRMSELLPSGVLTLVFTLQKGDLATNIAATGDYVSCSLNAGTHLGLLPSLEFQQEGAATSPTTRILKNRLDVVQFKIPKFLSVHTKEAPCVWSEAFPFMGRILTLGVLTGTRERNEMFPVLIRAHALETECSVELTFGIKKEDGQVENVAHISNLTFLGHEVCRRFDFPSFSREVLRRRRSELLPSGVLTLVFTLWKGDLATDITATASTCWEQSSSGGSSVSDFLLAA